MAKLVNVYEDNEIIARVHYNEKLDVRDARGNWTAPEGPWPSGTGRHLGITMLKDGTYVLVYGSDWQGDKDYAETVSQDVALRAVLESESYFSEKEFEKLLKQLKLTERYNALMSKEAAIDE